VDPIDLEDSMKRRPRFAAVFVGVLLFASLHAQQTPSSTQSSPQLFPIVQDGKWGYIDKTGKVTISPQFYYANDFHEGVAWIEPFAVLDISVRGVHAIRLQLIDESGKVCAPKIYSSALPFYEGLALATVPGEHGAGYIDITGKFVIAQDDSLQWAGSFSEGLAAIKQGGKIGFIDKTGKTVIVPQFSEVYRYREGLAAVKQGKRWGFLDKTGKIVIPPQYEIAYGHFEGLAAVRDGGKWGFIDKTGAMAIKPQFSDALEFADGLAPVKEDGKWGYIDKTGTMVISPRYEVAGRLSEGLAAIKQGGKWGFIDKNGQMIIQPQFEVAAAFMQGIANVRIDKKLGYIDQTGKYIWSPSK
jgi:WG containing repeat